MKPTVFITNFHPFISKNVLSSGVLDNFTQKAKVVIFVTKEKENHFKDIYEKDGVIVEGVDLSSVVRSPMNKFFIRIQDHLQDTNAIKFQRMVAVSRREKSTYYYHLAKYYFGQLFTKIFSRIKHFRVFVRWLDYKLNNPRPFDPYFKKYNPDVVFSTDVFNDFDLPFLKSARYLAVKNVGMLRSWDNTTSRGYLRFVPDRLIVHNEVGKKEMIKYHDINEKTIYIGGIPQFEKYLKILPSPREEFLKKIGADPTRRLILFAPAGHFFIDTDWQVCQMLKDLHNEGKIPGDVQFMIRIHPFMPLDFHDFVPDGNFIIDSPGPAKPNHLEKGKKEGELDNTVFFQHIYDSLYHSSLIINTISSLIVDTMIVDKPLITINFNGWEKKVPFVRDLVKRWRLEENQISWMSFGATVLVKNKEELALWINKYLEDPGIHGRERKAFKDAYAWKFDGKSGERIAAIVLDWSFKN